MARRAVRARVGRCQASRWRLFRLRIEWCDCGLDHSIITVCLLAGQVRASVVVTLASLRAADAAAELRDRTLLMGVVEDAATAGMSVGRPQISSVPELQT